MNQCKNQKSARRKIPHLALVLACSIISNTTLAEVSPVGGVLNANFDGMTLEEALGEIAATTGIEITTSQALEQKLTVSYSNITPTKLLKRLLHGYNAIYLQHPQTGKLNKVRIFSTGNAPAIAQQSPAETATEAQEENGKFYLVVNINGRPLKLLVDTGANTLALSAQVASSLALPSGQPTPVQTAGGAAHAYRTVVDSVVMAGKELKGVQAIILPNLKENGLIGQNVLAHYRRVTADGKMRFEPIGVKPQGDAPAEPASPPITPATDKGKALPQPKSSVQPSTQPSS